MKLLFGALTLTFFAAVACMIIFSMKPGTLKQEVSYTTGTTAQSTFSGGLAYFSINQDDSGKIAVKQLSVFRKMITETCVAEKVQILSATPCGTGVMINGELAFSAMLVAYTPVQKAPTREAPKKTF